MASPVQTLCETINADIASGQSLSGAINMQGRVLTGLYVPSGWTAADITFQSSPDGVTWYDHYDVLGEAKVSAVAGKYHAVDNSVFMGANFLKVRSGISAGPVTQAAARTVILMGGTPAKAQ